jgi:hypothetical protein
MYICISTNCFYIITILNFMNLKKEARCTPEKHFFFIPMMHFLLSCIKSLIEYNNGTTQ